MLAVTARRASAAMARHCANKNFLAAVTDTYLVGTITSGRRGTVMQGFSNPSPIRRVLTQAEIEAIVVYIRSLNAK